MKNTKRNQGGLASELAGLPDLDRPELIGKWEKACGIEAPAGISRSLLLHSLAYRMQAQRGSSLKPATRRMLEKIAHENGVSGITPPPATVKIGTRLLREWRGVVHDVVILEKGVLYNGKTHKSLSEVAGIITGARWSGPAFFGLRKKAT